ncbi:hypothetical protein ES703_99648 [subsurface metagenome]
MAVILPQGALFRKGAEGKIREALLKEDLIEAVIGLAPNLFYGTPLAGCVVILRRKKPAKRKNKVLIIDASSIFHKGHAQNFLDPDHGERIVRSYHNFEDVQNHARVATLDEIKNKGWTLTDRREHPAAAGSCSRFQGSSCGGTCGGKSFPLGAT